MKQNKYQSGSGHIVIIIALIVVLLGALGFVLWQNFMQAKDSDTKTTTTTTNTTTTTQLPLEGGSITVVTDFLTEFLDYMRPSSSNHSEIDYISQSSDFSAAFKERILNNEGPVYSSQVLLAQDIPSGWILGTVVEESTISSVEVILLFNADLQDQSFRVTYSVIIEDNAWKIDSVVKN